MKEKMSPVGSIVLTILITAAVVGSGAYYFEKRMEEPVQAIIETTQASEKSFVEYYTTRDQFLNNTLTKKPEELGFIEMAKVKIACPENADGPCGGDLLVLSKESARSDNQEFYLAQAGGTGYSYYGPFTDDLQRIINESKTIHSLNDSY